MWARIVDVIRALIVLAGYIVIVAGGPLCEENAIEILGIKLCGTFFLCCLASLATKDRRGRTGWTKLTEIVCSRKSFLLLIYIVAWTYVVNAAANLRLGYLEMYVSVVGWRASCLTSSAPYHAPTKFSCLLWFITVTHMHVQVWSQSGLVCRGRLFIRINCSH